jgi:hypothetical protein
MKKKARFLDEGKRAFVSGNFRSCFVARSSERVASKDREQKGPEAAYQGR